MALMKKEELEAIFDQLVVMDGAEFGQWADDIEAQVQKLNEQMTELRERIEDKSVPMLERLHCARHLAGIVADLENCRMKVEVAQAVGILRQEMYRRGVRPTEYAQFKQEQSSLVDDITAWLKDQTPN